jgi:3''-phosphoadenosine 5''-phosphosulfate sulfotransferase (PAPS reductase)/FAD synthetase and related enzymes
VIVHVADVKFIASCSWGKDSTAMILKLIEMGEPLDEVIFYDTGMEFKAIYSVRDMILPTLKEYNIKYTELKPDNLFLYDMLIRPKIKRKTKQEAYGDEWCGKCRWQTFIKQRICNRYTGTDNIVYVGIAFDEPKRLQNLDSYKKAPLAEWKMKERDCLEYCFSKGIYWKEDGVELYSILDRVSCWCCQNSNLRELKNMYLYLPRYWRMLKGLQSRIDTPMKGEGKSVFQLEERFKKEIEQEGGEK